MKRNQPWIHGRGATSNPKGRFEKLDVIYEQTREAERGPRPETILLRDDSKRVLSKNDSPDLPFTYSLNPYRGCEHGCAYCYARPTHEYLGFSAGLDFETRILVKERAPELLRRELAHARWRPQTVVMSGVTDPYQPVERKLTISRRCVEVFADARNPVAIVTKNHLVTRDIDHLSELAEVDACAVFLSVPTLDAALAAELEPRASHPRRRIEAIRALSASGIPTGVMVAPVIPGLTDHEIPHILDRAAEAGARSAGYVMLRLPFGLEAMFENWLRAHRPDRAERVLNRVRDVRNGNMNDTAWGRRLRGTGRYADQIGELFRIARDRSGLASRGLELNIDAFRRPRTGPQMDFF